MTTNKILLSSFSGFLSFFYITIDGLIEIHENINFSELTFRFDRTAVIVNPLHAKRAYNVRYDLQRYTLVDPMSIINKFWNFESKRKTTRIKSGKSFYKISPEAEFKEFEPRLKFKPRLKYGWFHLNCIKFLRFKPALTWNRFLEDLSRGSNSLNSDSVLRFLIPLLFI